MRWASRWPLSVHISNACRLLSLTVSSTKIAIFDPVGEGMRAFILGGNSIGGGMNGGEASAVSVGRGMLYRNCLLEFESMSRTDLVA